MKREISSEEATEGLAGHFAGEDRGGVQGSEEGLASFHPFSASTARGLPPPSTAKQVPSWSTSRLSYDHSPRIDLGIVSSPLAPAGRLWSFGSAEIYPSAFADISSLKGQLTGMNRWKGDARKPVETPETGVGKADSADSAFGSTLSKKSKVDLKLRADQALKAQLKEKLPTPTLKLSMSQSNEFGSPMDVQRDRDLVKQVNAGPRESLFLEKQVFLPQRSEPEEPVAQEQVFDMHHIRSTILKQEAVFREQVQELHRVHDVQSLLMAELRREDSDLLAHPSGGSVGGSSQSPSFGVNSGLWNRAMGQGLGTAGHDFEASIALPDTLKGGSTFRQRDPAVSRPLQEANLLKQSAGVSPVRRKFDLERPPEDDEDDQVVRRENDYVKPEGNRTKLVESPESCSNETESDIFSLNLGTRWGRGEVVKEDSYGGNKVELEVSRALKRPREEPALFPFLALKPESLRDAPLRPTPTVADQSFLGGLWGLQLGRKLDSSSAQEGNRTPEESEVPNKKERLSLNLEVEEKEVPTATSNGALHWLLKAPAAKPSKKAVCHTESSSLNFQDSFSPPRNSTDHGMLKPFPQNRGQSGSSSTPGMFWDSEGRVSEPPPRNRSQSSQKAPEMFEDNMQTGSKGVHQAQVLNMDLTGSERIGYGLPWLAQGMGEAPGEAHSLYSSWREVGDVRPNSFAHGVFTQSHPLARAVGVQLSTMEGHPGLAAQGLVQVGPTVNMGARSAPFVLDSGPGMWYQQRNSDCQYQQYQRQQEFVSRQPGVVSSSQQGPAPMQISQGGGYGQGTAVFAIPAAAGPPLGFPLYGVQKVGDDLPVPNWTSGTVGPPFTPFSIVVPPKPPFKRPPKLVLTHDGTTMELKLVSPAREVGAKVAAEKAFSGSSDEELSENKEQGSTDVTLMEGRVQDDRDVSLQCRGRSERDKKERNGGSMKEKGSPSSGGASDWMVKVLSTAAGRTGIQNGSSTVVPMVRQEGMDDGDGGSSDVGSGGSGVGDVINPGDGASPSMATCVGDGSNRNLPAGEGEEGVHMGELGLQADSESHSGKFDRKEKPSKKQEESASLSLRSRLSMIARKISRESSDGPGHVVDDTQKCVQRTEGLSEEVEKRAPVFHRVLEQSGSSSGALLNLPVQESHSHGLCPQQNLNELRNVQLELQQPTYSTSQVIMTQSSKLEDSLKQGKECSKVTESSTLGLEMTASREKYHGRVAMDIDDTERGKTHVRQRNASFSNYGDVSRQERESRVGHSKLLSGAKTSEKDGVQLKPYSPVLHQISSTSSMVDMERLTEGSSIKVSQASETDQGNGRSPRRTSQWIDPTAMEQDHFCSPGGIDSSCDEVDGTLTSCNDSSITWSELEEEVQRTW